MDAAAAAGCAFVVSQLGAALPSAPPSVFAEAVAEQLRVRLAAARDGATAHAEALTALGEATAAVAAAQGAYSAAAELDAYRAHVAAVSTLQVGAEQLAALSAEAEVKHAAAEAGAARLSTARARVRAAVEACSPTEVAVAVAFKALDGLSERAEAEAALPSLVVASASAYDALAQAQRRRAELAAAAAAAAAAEKEAASKRDNDTGVEPPAEPTALALAALEALKSLDALTVTALGAAAASAAALNGGARVCPAWPSPRPEVETGKHTEPASPGDSPPEDGVQHAEKTTAAAVADEGASDTRPVELGEALFSTSGIGAVCVDAATTSTAAFAVTQPERVKTADTPISGAEDEQASSAPPAPAAAPVPWFAAGSPATPAQPFGAAAASAVQKQSTPDAWLSTRAWTAADDRGQRTDGFRAFTYGQHTSAPPHFGVAPVSSGATWGAPTVLFGTPPAPAPAALAPSPFGIAAPNLFAAASAPPLFGAASPFGTAAAAAGHDAAPCVGTVPPFAWPGPAASGGPSIYGVGTATPAAWKSNTPPKRKLFRATRSGGGGVADARPLAFSKAKPWILSPPIGTNISIPAPVGGATAGVSFESWRAPDPDENQSVANLHHLCACPVYAKHSPEELRAADYQTLVRGMRPGALTVEPIRQGIDAVRVPDAECLAAVLRAEAAALEALAAAAASVLPAVRAALAAAAPLLASETAAADAHVAAELAASVRGAACALTAAREALAADEAARPAAAAAQADRVRALLALEDLDSQRRKKMLLQEWTPAAQAKHDTLSADARAAAAAAEEVLRAAETRTAARVPLLAEAYPEAAVLAAAGVALAAAAQASGPASATGETLSMASFEVVEAIERTPARELLRCRRRDAPGARDVCLKVFAPESARAFLAEARHLASLAAHPLIIKFEGSFVDPLGRGVLVMPYLPGGSLRPWTEALKRKTGGIGLAGAAGLSTEEWASVRRTYRQLVSALAFIHSRGVAHRDLKPENVLWADGAAQRTIALADFGLSRDLGAVLESTLPPAATSAGRGGALAGGGTRAYAAPEAGSPAWKATPWAGDIWSLGVMALEIATGSLFCWTGRRLEMPGEPERGTPALPPGAGAAMHSLSDLAFGCLKEVAEERPSADEALLFPFFSASEAAASDAHGDGAADGAAFGAKLAALTAAAAAARGGAGEPWLLVVPPVPPAEADDVARATWAAAFLDAVAAVPTAALARPWRPQAGTARAPMSAAMRAFWSGAPHIRSLLVQCDAADAQAAPRMDLPFHVRPDDAPDAAPEPRLQALGRVLGKCTQEGLSVDIELTTVAFAAALGTEGAALADPGAALSLLGAYDDGGARSHARLLASRLGDGSPLLTGDMFAGQRDGDAAPVSDATKRAVVARDIAHKLVGARRAGLDALRSGFAAVLDAAGVAPTAALLSCWELASYLSGGAAQYIDVAALKARVVWDDAWPISEPQRRYFDLALDSLSEPALRLLLTRAAGRARVPGAGASLLILRRRGRGEADVTPRLFGNGVIELYAACPSAEAFLARLVDALHVREAAAAAPRTAPEKLAAEARASIAALQAAGQVRRGAVYACPNGHIYTIGDCGGAMERGRCPECGATIGGEQHRAEQGNAVRLDVDGAEAPAWPPPR